MVETIAPVVYGSRTRYFFGAAIHALSATVAAAAFGALLGLIGLVIGAPWGAAGTIAVTMIAMLYVAREAFRLPVPIFDRKRQVPDWWRTFYAPSAAAALYGAGLGIGFLTFLGHGTLVVVVAIALASGSPVAGIALLAPFGFARGLTVLTTARSADETGPALIVARLSDIAAKTRWVRVANAVACGAIALAAFTACSQPNVIGYADVSPSPATSSAVIAYGRPRIVGRIADARVTEASGIAASRTHRDVLWVHNDSGDDPRLYCTRLDGSSCGRVEVEGADAYDWEDLALGPGPGRADYLYIGDIGDNNRERRSITVYRIPEPNPGREASVAAQGFELHYPDRPHDAETLMVHPGTGAIFIVTKETRSDAHVYSVSGPLGHDPELRRIARIEVGSALDPVTGGAIAPDGKRLILATYIRGYELVSNNFEGIWSSSPKEVPLGRRPQGEAVTYSADGTAIYATTEGPRPAIWAVSGR